MKTLEISDETYEKIKDQLGEDEQFDLSDLDSMLNQKFFFRTVTYHIIGKVENFLTNKVMELSGACWVADSGRFMNAIKDGDLSEVEPVGQMWINLDTVTDFFPWNHSLPKDQK